MPIYEFLCSACGHKFEQLVSSMSDDADRTCPQCAGLAKKQLSTFSAHSGGSKKPCDSGGCCPDATGTGCSGGSCPFS